MKGFYFVNSDIDNKRAHTFQILSTVEFVNSVLSLELVFPHYDKKDYDLERLFSDYGLKGKVPVNFQSVFGRKEACLTAFLLFDISAAYFLLKQKLRGQVDFIYLRSSLFFLLTLVVRVLRVPFFYETHRKPMSWSERWRDTFLAKRAAGLIVTSGGLKQYYSKYNENILVVHDAVSLQRFDSSLNKGEAREKLAIPREATVGVYYGGVRKIKGVETIFAAAQKLAAITFKIIGLVSSEFNDQVIPPNVQLLGEKPQAELPPYLKAADFLLIPHPDNEYSQSPMKLFEYLAAGRPIISADLPNLKEVLPQPGNLFFEPQNSDSLTIAIKKYLGEKEMYDKDAQQNILVAKEHTWEKRGEKIARFIQQSMTK